MITTLTFAVENLAQSIRVVGVPEICAAPALNTAPSKAFRVVTISQTKVIQELRKRMPVGHLFALVCR